MSKPQGPKAPDLCSPGVATLAMVSSCPICGRPQTGKQTVCSPKCRIQRSMRRREVKRQQDLAKLRLLLQEALQLLEAPRPSEIYEVSHDWAGIIAVSFRSYGWLYHYADA